MLSGRAFVVNLAWWTTSIYYMYLMLARKLTPHSSVSAQSLQLFSPRFGTRTRLGLTALFGDLCPLLLQLLLAALSGNKVPSHLQHCTFPRTVWILRGPLTHARLRVTQRGPLEGPWDLDQYKTRDNCPAVKNNVRICTPDCTKAWIAYNWLIVLMLGYRYASH